MRSATWIPMQNAVCDKCKGYLYRPINDRPSFREYIHEKHYVTQIPDHDCAAKIRRLHVAKAEYRYWFLTGEVRCECSEKEINYE